MLRGIRFLLRCRLVKYLFRGFAEADVECLAQNGDLGLAVFRRSDRMLACFQCDEQRLEQSHRPTLAVLRDVDVQMRWPVVPSHLLPRDACQYSRCWWR